MYSSELIRFPFKSLFPFRDIVFVLLKDLSGPYTNP